MAFFATLRVSQAAYKLCACELAPTDLTHPFCHSFSVMTSSAVVTTFNPTRAWWKSACIYQIYPISFFDSNGDGIGDLPGILAKLDYLKELGVDILWLCPIYKSPLADMGYDIADYESIDPRFGTLEDWDRLLEGVHKRGMKLLYVSPSLVSEQAHLTAL